MPGSPQDVYARLLSSRRGYPLWTPEPSNELLIERQDGLRIGDVGVVIPDDGGFDVFFNICLPADHPFHRRHGIPEGFTFIHPEELDIRTIPNAEYSGRIISTSSVTQVETAEPSSSAPQGDETNALAYRFTLSSNEGALLILPKGAEQIDLLNEGLFAEQASRHGPEWYNYAVNRRHRIINHDSLYLITGFHKAQSWSVAAFDNMTGNDCHTAHFKRIQARTQGYGYGPTYSWETSCALDWRVGPHIDYGVANQAVFIRGLKIALRNGLLGTRRISVETGFPSTGPIPAKLSSIVSSNSWSFRRGFSRPSRGDRGSNVPQITMHNLDTAGPTEGPPPSDVLADSGYDDMHVEIQRVPDVLATFHPSDAINQYLLRKEPSADIAITHDNLWISILENGLLTLEEFGQESRLERVLSQNYNIVSREGAIRLERKDDLDILDDDKTLGSEREALSDSTTLLGTLGAVSESTVSTLTGGPATLPISAGKGGCWTCRLRRKKCDGQREGGSCRTCKRLQIECLGWGARRPEWMRDKRAVEIKVKLTKPGFIRGQPRSSIMQANSSSSSTVFATEQYQGPVDRSTIHSLINDTGASSLTIADTPQTQGQGESPTLTSMFGLPLSSPFIMSPPPTDPSLMQLLDDSPYTPPTLPTSPQVFGLDHKPTTLSAHALQSELVFYYFDHVRKSLFPYMGNLAANAIYSVVSRNPQGPLTNAIKALSSLHNMRIRAARGLESANSTLENSPATIFYDTAHAQLYKSRESVLTEDEANAALHLLCFSLLSGGVTDWRPMLDIANDWMVQTGIPTHENPKLAMMGMTQIARLTLKATMWLDVMSTITLHTIPKHLAFYRRLYRRLDRGGSVSPGTSGMSAKEDSDLRVDSLTGCPDEILLDIAEISTLSCWKAQEVRRDCLSMEELVRRGNIIESHLRSCESMYPHEPDQTPLHPDLLPVSPTAVEASQPVANMYREAALLYLYTILRGPVPGSPEVIQSIDVIVELVDQLPTSALDRAPVFPIYLAGCLTDDPVKREILKTRLVALLPSQLENVYLALIAMETAWLWRDTRGRAVEWSDLLHAQGRNPVLLV